MIRWKRAGSFETARLIANLFSAYIRRKRTGKYLPGPLHNYAQNYDASKGTASLNAAAAGVINTLNLQLILF